MQHSAQDELAAAIAAERAAWAKVKDKLPGSPGYDAALWEAWRVAANRCHAARAALRAGDMEPKGTSGRRAAR